MKVNDKIKKRKTIRKNYRKPKAPRVAEGEFDFSAEYKVFLEMVENVSRFISVIDNTVEKLPELMSFFAMDLIVEFFKDSRTTDDEISSKIKILEENSKGIAVKMSEEFRKKCIPGYMSSEHIRKIHQLIIEQAVILLVSALETYLKDRLRAILNENPKLSVDYFKEKYITIYDIVEHSFDISHKMGNIMANKCNFQNQYEVTQAFVLTLGFKPFDLLTDSEFRALRSVFETRHILIHNGGIIDRSFIRKTDVLPEELINKRIIVKTDYIERALNVVKNFAYKIEKKCVDKLNSKV